MGTLFNAFLFTVGAENLPPDNTHAHIHRRGRLNLPDNSLCYIFVSTFGRIQSAPTVDDIKRNLPIPTFYI
ncbi:MAG: hypothetical protein LUI85_20065 [Bacteroides sp.]|nr:hypothetical protein [Bacteroides sp.]